MRLQAVDAGIRTDNVISMRVALNFSKYTTPALRAQFLTSSPIACAIFPASDRLVAPATFPMNEGGGFLAGVRIRRAAGDRGGAAAAGRVSVGDALGTSRPSAFRSSEGRLIDAATSPIASRSPSSAIRWRGSSFPRPTRSAPGSRSTTAATGCASSGSSATCAIRWRRSRRRRSIVRWRRLRS